MAQQWIGETFMTTSKHPEEAGRTIQIRAKKPTGSLSFTVVNVAHPARPDLVGRESTISAKTLTGSAWRRLEPTTGPAARAAAPSAARQVVEETLARIQDRHDQENLEAHTDCDTLVLLGGIRAALAACDNAPGGLDPAAVQVAIAAGMRAR
ncbi:hypothetical protein ACO229_06755 [Promicromonospora sp. MS192]|uniref:hypothetical protein n=1 Tax=Promicromonospora sp. MS192 TaxID=3412684 RepID=UPI003C2C7605